jgi:hypothetical protein
MPKASGHAINVTGDLDIEYGRDYDSGAMELSKRTPPAISRVANNPAPLDIGE